MKQHLLIIFLLSSVACTSSSTTETVADAEATSIMEEIKLKDLDNHKIDLTDYKGKRVFINFWATWCRPCIAEMPSIEKAQTSLKEEPIAFLLVSNEPQAQIKKFTSSRQFDFNYARLDMPLSQLNIKGLPTTMIIDEDGQVVYNEMGARDWHDEESLKIIRGELY